MNKVSVVILLIILFRLSVHGQHLTSSPYSMYGLGQYETNDNGRNAAMGGIGIGMSSDGHLNLINPASLTDLLDETFYFDMGIALRNSTYRSGNASESVTSWNFHSIAIGFKPMKNWGLATGLIPITSTGYKIKTSQYIEGTTLTDEITFEGEGGLSKLFFSNGWQISPSISIGGTASFLFGSISQDELQSTITIKETSYMRDFYLEGGFQFKEYINENMPFTIGLIYGYSNKLKKDNERTVFGSDGVSIILEETNLPSTYGYLPEYYGLGLYSGYGENWQFGVDFLYQDWSRNNSGTSSILFTDVKKLNAGLQYVPKPRIGNRLFEKIRYRAGFSIENSYLVVRGQNPLIYKVSGGFGIPLRGNSMLNLAISWEDDSMSGRNNTIQSSSLNFSLGISFSEIWFMKRQFE